MNARQNSWVKGVRFSAVFVFITTFWFSGLALNVYADSPTVYPVEERIVSFTSRVELREDRSATITENIFYDFSSNERNGIFRYIPYKYKGLGGANDEIPLFGFEVLRDGKSETFDVSKVGGEMQIKIGDPDVTISGVHEYLIRYTAKEITGSFDGYDEVYWNVTGNEWNVPMNAVSARVILPRDIPPPQASLACYYGPFGSRDGCAPDLSLFSRTFNEFDFESPRELSPREGMTIAVGFPKGIVKERTTSEIVGNFIKSNGIAVLPLIVFLFMFRHWRRYGKDPKGRGIIVPEYDVPEKLSVLEIAGLMRGSVGANDISAGLIELAVKGYIKIEQIDEKILGIIPTKDYKFIEVKEENVLLAEPEKELMRIIFSSGARQSYDSDLREVKLSELKKENFVIKFHGLKKAVMDSLISRSLYEKSPILVTAKYFIFSFIVLFVSIFFSAFFENALIFLSFVFVSLIIMIFGFYMAKVTKFGALIKERILGLKEYLQIAEKDRLKFHNAPEKRPEVFEKLLPYAMVLGVEKSWAKEFEGIYTQNPAWYSGPNNSIFSAIAFTNDMHSFAVTTSTAVNPHSSSGSGGGGFSGGGGGGGGGRSW